MFSKEDVTFETIISHIDPLTQRGFSVKASVNYAGRELVAYTYVSRKESIEATEINEVVKLQLTHILMGKALSLSPNFIVDGVTLVEVE